MRNNSKNRFGFRPVVKKEMPFKDISYLELWQAYCSDEQNYLCNFAKHCYEQQFCEIILNWGQRLRRKCS